MTSIAINPGSGPCSSRTTWKQSRSNARQFARDLRFHPAMMNSRARVEYVGLTTGLAGYYTWLLQYDVVSIEVDVPGLPMDQVRHLGDYEPWLIQLIKDDWAAPRAFSIWRAKRLYVHGNSWTWTIALDVVADALAGTGAE